MNKKNLLIAILTITSFSFAHAQLTWGFEADTLGMAVADGWGRGTWGGAEGTFTIVDDNVNSGNQAYQIVVTSTPGDNPRKSNISTWRKPESVVAVDAGETYQFSFYAKADETGKTVNVDVRAFDEQVNLSSYEFTLTEEYQEYVLEYVAESADSFGVHIGFANATGLYWVDDVTAVNTSIVNTTEVLTQPSMFKAYPTVVTEAVTVEQLDANFVNHEVAVVNAVGQVLFTQSSNDTKYTLDMSTYTNGAYWLVIRTEDHEEVIPVVKQ